MKRSYLYILIAAVGAAAIIGGVTYVVVNRNAAESGADQGKATSLTSGAATVGTADQVAATTDEDVIRAFFKLIDDDLPSEAALAMSAKNVNDDSTKQAWAVMFHDMSTVTVSSVAPSMQSTWTDTMHEYEVGLNVNMSSTAANATIPYYGYNNGGNTRFIILVKEAGSWKVDGIATGP